MQSLVARLFDASKSIEKDDLSGMAKMHGWCESLAQLTVPDGASPCQPLHEIAGVLGNSLETLVLGLSDDAAATLAAVKQCVFQIVELEATLDTTAGGAGESAPPSKEQESAGPDQVTAEDDRAGGSPGDEGNETTPTAPDGDATGANTAEPATSDEPAYKSEPLVLKDNETEFVKGFVEEAAEHIEAIEGAVLEVERSPDDAEKINDLFRPFHTIKGMAGFLNLRDVNCLTHEVETLLDQGRKGDRKITPGLIDLVFDVVDILQAQVGAISGYLVDPQGDTVPQPPVEDMICHLRRVVAGKIDPTGRRPEAGSAALKTGENLVEQGAVAKEAVDFALERQKSGLTDKKTGEILIDDQAVTPRQVSQAIRPQAQASAAAKTQGSAPADLSVRIDTGKLDTLVDMVGELVIAQTLVSTNGTVSDEPRLSKDVSQVTKIVRDVQEVAMGMRMVPIGPTFQRMARLVRDVSRKAGKTVELHITGEDTELDKNVIQQIGDPLVHMVRNAVDHGVESPEDRQQAGKETTGHVHLSAFHHGGNIVIEIRDDGKGLDRDKLIAKGIEKGIITSGDDLTDQQAFGLVFAPGFSTAEKVTDISGRGVGMDVAKRNIEQLRGRVEITSEKGKGSTFTIRLPLTLAIIDGMIIGVAGERFIVPTINIEQSLRPLPEHITSVQHRAEVLQVRGELVPLIQLGELFGLKGRVDPCEAMVVIAQSDDRRVGIVVEELIGQQQVVIKTLGERFKKLRGISGAAILGDGRIGLILEMSGLEAAHNARTHRSATSTGTSADGPDDTGQDEDALGPENEEAASIEQDVAEPVLA